MSRPSPSVTPKQPRTKADVTDTSAEVIVVHDHTIGPVGKRHLSADDGRTAMCGLRSDNDSGFRVRGNRTMFEERCPEVICQRCRKAEALSS